MSFGTIVLERFLTVVGERALLVYSFITACHNARIASAVAVLAIAIPSDCPSVRPSVTRRYCVKTMARSRVQFALSIAKCV